MKAAKAWGRVSLSEIPYRSRCAAPSMWPAQNSGAWRVSMMTRSSPLRSPMRSASCAGVRARPWIHVALVAHRPSALPELAGAERSSLPASSLVVGDAWSGRTYTFAFPSGVTKR